MKFLSTGNKSKKYVRILAVVLAAIFILACLSSVIPFLANASSSSSHNYTSDKIIRIGINYNSKGTNSLVSSVSAKFDNGFQLGTFDSSSNTFTAFSSFSLNEVTIRSSSDPSVIAFFSGENLIYTYTCNENPVFLRAEDSGTQNGGKIYLSDGNTYSGLLGLSRSGSENISIINYLYLEDYVKGVLVSEIFPSWPEESLKVAAVIARTFALYNINSHSQAGFDICNTTHCQCFDGVGNTSASTNAATDATHGLVVKYNGSPALTTYFSSCADTTESAEGAWGGDSSKYPYLTNVDLGFDITESVPNGRWSYTVTATELTDYINSKSAYAGKLSGKVEKIVCERRPGSPYVYKLTVTDNLGNSIEVTKSSSVRNFLFKYCKSADFTVSVQTSILLNNNEECTLDSQNLYVISSSGTQTVSAFNDNFKVLTSDGLKKVTTGSETVFTIQGYGYGHGVGLSQYGNKYLAENGYTYENIINIFYPGTEISHY